MHRLSSMAVRLFASQGLHHRYSPRPLVLNAEPHVARSIRSTSSFVLSFFAIVALGIFYEWLRFFARRIDRSIARSLATANGGKGKARVSRSRSISPVDRARAEEESLLTGSYKVQQKCVQYAL